MEKSEEGKLFLSCLPVPKLEEKNVVVGPVRHLSRNGEVEVPVIQAF